MQKHHSDSREGSRSKNWKHSWKCQRDTSVAECTKIRPTFHQAGRVPLNAVWTATLPLDLVQKSFRNSLKNKDFWHILEGFFIICDPVTPTQTERHPPMPEGRYKDCCGGGGCWPDLIKIQNNTRSAFLHTHTRIHGLRELQRSLQLRLTKTELPLEIKQKKN